jgi:hypothetical protein
LITVVWSFGATPSWNIVEIGMVIGLD